MLMGMAASQARYLALTARKSNVEYEGQQINQARTALANQTANLFNQMLGMGVPTPPSTTDYTTIQYTFSDGANTEVLSNFYQLGNSDSDYNYVVTTYHNEKVFTGSKKKMNDPQIQATTTNHFSYATASTDNNTSKTVTKAWSNADGTYGLEATDGSTTIFRPVTAKEEDQVKAINKGNGAFSTTEVDKVGTGTVDLTDGATLAAFAGVQTTDADDVAIIKQLYGLDDTAVINNDDYYKDTNGNYITAAQQGAAAADTEAKFVEEFAGKGIEPAGTDQTYYTDGKQFITKTDLESAVQKYDNFVATGRREPNDVNIISVTNDPEFSNYSAIGNLELTELKASDLEDEDIKAEIDQIMKDMMGSNGDKVASENFAACFDTDANGDLVYKGGIYTFQMGGTMYYTTKNDLDKSAGTSIVDNEIDVQQEKLSYYNASYLEKQVEDTQKALLETDGQGRFKTIKLEDDSVTYSLNTETVTDEAAYNDAMNRYYYENAVYEKSIADINAKTETIQAQDRTLELRLEQLNTEQSALQNEMEAVKKVVDKHVELGFKTFGG